MYLRPILHKSDHLGHALPGARHVFIGDASLLEGKPDEFTASLYWPVIELVDHRISLAAVEPLQIAAILPHLLRRTLLSARLLPKTSPKQCGARRRPKGSKS